MSHVTAALKRTSLDLNQVQHFVHEARSVGGHQGWFPFRHAERNDVPPPLDPELFDALSMRWVPKSFEARLNQRSARFGVSQVACFLCSSAAPRIAVSLEFSQELSKPPRAEQLTHDRESALLGVALDKLAHEILLQIHTSREGHAESGNRVPRQECRWPERLEDLDVGRIAFPATVGAFDEHI